MFRSIRVVWQHARWWSVAIALWLGPAALSWAAPRRKEAEPPKEPVYALEYAVVIFAILIALAVVLRPGRRTELVDELKLPVGAKK